MKACHASLIFHAKHVPQLPPPLNAQYVSHLSPTRLLALHVCCIMHQGLTSHMSNVCCVFHCIGMAGPEDCCVENALRVSDPAPHCMHVIFASAQVGLPFTTSRHRTSKLGLQDVNSAILPACMGFLLCIRSLNRSHVGEQRRLALAAASAHSALDVGCCGIHSASVPALLQHLPSMRPFRLVLPLCLLNYSKLQSSSLHL